MRKPKKKKREVSAATRAKLSARTKATWERRKAEEKRRAFAEPAKPLRMQSQSKHAKLTKRRAAPFNYGSGRKPSERRLIRAV